MSDESQVGTDEGVREKGGKEIERLSCHKLHQAIEAHVDLVNKDCEKSGESPERHEKKQKKEEELALYSRLQNRGNSQLFTPKCSLRYRPHGGSGELAACTPYWNKHSDVGPIWLKQAAVAVG